MAILETPQTKQTNPEQTKHKLRINLPSNKIIPNYPASVNVSCFTVNDMKTLIPLANSNYFPALVKTIQNLCDVNVEDLTISDFQYIVVWIRTNSVGNTAEFTVTCNSKECGNSFSHQVDLTKLPVKNLDPSYKEPFKLKLSESILNLKLPRIRDYQVVLEQEEKDQWLYLMGAAMEGDIEENVSTLNKLSPKDSNLIKMFLDTYDYGIDILLKMNCNECGREVPFILPFRPDIFFWTSPSESHDNFRKAVLS